jgi:CheY-like chemotaxis protein
MARQTGARHRILLVDDSRDEREMYAEWLRANGYCTLLAERAADGFRLALELKPDVAVVDMALPGSEDGLLLTRRLKESESTRGVPVIILTGHVFPANREQAYAAGCDLFLAKPCPPDDLARAIAGLMIQAPAAAPLPAST